MTHTPTTPPSPPSGPPGHPFANVRRCIIAMLRATEGSQVDLIALAKAYAELSTAMVEDVGRAGQTSMRFLAVQKALQLRTAKSALQRFLDER